MRNPIDLYEKFDAKAIQIANKVVRSYNYTTGRTKGQLANNLMDLFCASFSTVFIMSESYLLIPLTFLVRKNIQEEYNRIEKLEEVAQEKKTLNVEVQKWKDDRKYRPIFYYAMMGVSFRNSKESLLSNSIDALSWSFWGASDYIMRADYIKPRKTNVWSRAKRKYGRKLRDMGKSLKPQPSPQPNNLESYLE